MEEGSTLQPGQLIRPQTTEDQAKDLAHRLYGFTVTSIKELKSYDDKNFFIKVCEDHNNPHVRTVSTDGYILKVLNSMDSQKTHVEAEHEAERLCIQAGVSCPLPVPNVFGNDYSKEILQNPNTNNNDNRSAKTEHLVRLLTFVPGKMFVDVPYTPALLHDAGLFLARLTNALKGFTHPSLQGHTSIWSLSSVPKLTEFYYVITDEKRKALLTDVIKSFSETVIPRLKDCSKGVIHGDYNEQNIVVKPTEATKDLPESERDYCVAGVIDFGDMNESYYIFEVAIAIMYMMVESKVVDPMLAGGHLLAGYLLQRSLNVTEWEVLKTCVAARYCQSLVMGAYTYSLDPGNEYLLVTAANGWPQLERLWNTPTEQLYASWREVIASYKS